MITLHSTNCPKCKVIETKLNQLGIQYNVNTNINIMRQKGLASAPYLELEDGTLLNFMEARNWMQQQV